MYLVSAYPTNRTKVRFLLRKWFCTCDYGAFLCIIRTLKLQAYFKIITYKSAIGHKNFRGIFSHVGDSETSKGIVVQNLGT